MQQRRVEPEIWAFTIGGYRPAEKWLKDRKGRMLSDDEIDHYRKIVAALVETRLLMAEIDEVIGKHGGWPSAFRTDKSVLDNTDGDVGPQAHPVQPCGVPPHYLPR